MPSTSDALPTYSTTCSFSRLSHQCFSHWHGLVDGKVSRSEHDFPGLPVTWPLISAGLSWSDFWHFQEASSKFAIADPWGFGTSQALEPCRIEEPDDQARGARQSPWVDDTVSTRSLVERHEAHHERPKYLASSHVRESNIGQNVGKRRMEGTLIMENLCKTKDGLKTRVWIVISLFYTAVLVIALTKTPFEELASGQNNLHETKFGFLFVRQ